MRVEITKERRAKNAGFSLHPGLLSGKQQRLKGSTPYNRRVAAMLRKARGASRYTTAELKRMEKSARGSRGKRKLEGLFHEVYGGEAMPNPTAASIREEFVGREPETIGVFNEPHMPRGDYAQLGKLLSLHFMPVQNGTTLMELETPGTLAVSDESARQIWLVGGKQEITLAQLQRYAVQIEPGLWLLGEARRIDYKQAKDHLPGHDEWRHDFGEETGERPELLYDSRAKRLLLRGGAYVIRREGIRN